MNYVFTNADIKYKHSLVLLNYVDQYVHKNTCTELAIKTDFTMLVIYTC